MNDRFTFDEIYTKEYYYNYIKLNKLEVEFRGIIDDLFPYCPPWTREYMYELLDDIINIRKAIHIAYNKGIDNEVVKLSARKLQDEKLVNTDIHDDLVDDLDAAD